MLTDTIPLTDQPSTSGRYSGGLQNRHCQTRSTSYGPGQACRRGPSGTYRYTGQTDYGGAAVFDRAGGDADRLASCLDPHSIQRQVTTRGGPVPHCCISNAILMMPLILGGRRPVQDGKEGLGHDGLPPGLKMPFQYSQCCDYDR